MPPRKRTTPTPEPESLETPAEDTQEESPADDETTGGTPEEAAPPETPAEPAPTKSDRQEAEQPCAECFRDGWPDDATSVGCSHGTWNRDL